MCSLNARLHRLELIDDRPAFSAPFANLLGETYVGELRRQDRAAALSGTPTYHVLDHRGVIRFKWVGNPSESALDAALESLIREADQAAKKRPEPAPR